MQEQNCEAAGDLTNTVNPFSVHSWLWHLQISQILFCDLFFSCI